jgi:dGTP triphosphohydrolase
MYVLPHSEIEVILGLSWFSATGCSVNPSKRTIKFESEQFSIDDNLLEENEEFDSSFITEISSGDWADDIDLSSYDWNESLFKGIITNSQLTNDQKSKLKILSNKIRNSFAESLKDLGKCTILPYKIKMISDQIVHIPQYR